MENVKSNLPEQKAVKFREEIFVPGQNHRTKPRRGLKGRSIAAIRGVSERCKLQQCPGGVVRYHNFTQFLRAEYELF